MPTGQRSSADDEGRRRVRGEPEPGRGPGRILKGASSRLLLALDLGGTALFAVEGASAALTAHLDLLGALVLAFVTALAGGILRDVLIGAVPPASIRDWRYAAVALAAGAVTFGARIPGGPLSSQAVLVLDAVGLSLFSVAGAQKTVAYGLHPFMGVLMGGITGAGGGALRDVLLARVPQVLGADIYASAALVGAAVMLTGRRVGLAQSWASLAGAAICFGLRLLAAAYHWNLPRAS